MATATRDSPNQGIVRERYVATFRVIALIGQPDAPTGSGLHDRIVNVEEIGTGRPPEYRVSVDVSPGDRFKIDGDEYEYAGTAVGGHRVAFQPVDADAPTDACSSVRTERADEFDAAVSDADAEFSCRRIRRGPLRKLLDILPL